MSVALVGLLVCVGADGSKIRGKTGIRRIRGTLGRP